MSGGSASLQVRLARPLSALPPHRPARGGLLQRQCACGGASEPALPMPLAFHSGLAIGATDDPLEHEADRLMETVLKTSEAATPSGPDTPAKAALRRACAACENDGGAAAPLSVAEVVGESGRPLDPASRDFFAARFGHDFGQVRVHTDSRAANSAAEVGAHAYTVGSHIAFAQGRYAPAAPSGRRLIAHELAHVVQRGSTRPVVHRQMETDTDSASDGPAATQPVGADASSDGTTDLPSAGDGVAGGSAAAGLSNSLSWLPPLPTSLPPPCNPATSRIQAEALHAFVSISWLNFTRAMFGPQTTDLWSSYLDTTAGIPRAARAFSGSGEIVDGFTKHHKSAEAEMEVVKAAAAVFATPASASLLPAAGATATVPLTSVVPAATLSTRINDPADPMGLDYDSPATTIPGNIAGGIGAGGPPGNTVTDPDTRAVDGTLQLTRDATGASLTITPTLTFKVHDTVDFCPGALGGLVARVETVPMSILEATEARFGKVFAADVPFDVSYPGPGTASLTITPAPTPPPTPSPQVIPFGKDKPAPGVAGTAAFQASVVDNGQDVFDDLVAAMTANPALQVELIGRASPEGTAEYNLALGARRAALVAQALAEAGISPARIADAPSPKPWPECQSVQPGVVTCGEAGATGPADRQVVVQLFVPPPSP